MKNVVEPEFEITVLTGLHAGARASLTGRMHTVIGRDRACDLMLQDDDIRDRHVALICVEGKVSIARLNGDASIDGVALQTDKVLTLRKGTKLELGGVSLGLDRPGVDWSDFAATRPRSLLERVTLGLQQWLVRAPRRRRWVQSLVLSTAGACLLLAFLVPAHQWATRRNLRHVDIQADLQLLGARLDALHLPDLHVHLSDTSENIVADGYVPNNEDLRRIEKAILGTHVRPVMHVFSSERLLAEANDYVARRLSDSTVSASGVDAVQVHHEAPLQQDLMRELEQAMRRDIAGLNHVEFMAPKARSTVEAAPNPYSILSVADMRFLVAKDGSRYFPGADLGGRTFLRSIGTTTVWIEPKHGTWTYAASL